MTTNIENIYIVQEYIDENIVAEKMANEDYDIYVALLEDDGVMVPILVDGNHSLQAALRSGVAPVIHMAECDLACNTVEEYVIICRERSNPETISGVTLW